MNDTDSQGKLSEAFLRIVIQRTGWQNSYLYFPKSWRMKQVASTGISFLFGSLRTSWLGLWASREVYVPGWNSCIYKILESK